jgi:DNA-directed RNA polymerase specialized sigma24 family protein
VDIANLLNRIAAGDRDASAEVVGTFQRPLFEFLGRLGIPKAVAVEIAQETFLRAWRNLGQYQTDRAEFSTWLFSIAGNLALSEMTRASNTDDAYARCDERNRTCAPSTHVLLQLNSLPDVRLFCHGFRACISD